MIIQRIDEMEINLDSTQTRVTLFAGLWLVKVAGGVMSDYVMITQQQNQQVPGVGGTTWNGVTVTAATPGLILVEQDQDLFVNFSGAQKAMIKRVRATDLPEVIAAKLPK